MSPWRVARVRVLLIHLGCRLVNAAVLVMIWEKCDGKRVWVMLEVKIQGGTFPICLLLDVSRSLNFQAEGSLNKQHHISAHDCQGITSPTASRRCLAIIGAQDDSKQHLKDEQKGANLNSCCGSEPQIYTYRPSTDRLQVRCFRLQPSRTPTQRPRQQCGANRVSSRPSPTA